MKWFIHRKKQENNLPHFMDFLYYLKNVLIIQKCIAVKNKNADKYARDYGRIGEALEVHI